MADNNFSGSNDLFDDYIIDESETATTYENENAEIFSMLEVSDADIAKVTASLDSDDKKYASGSNYAPSENVHTTSDVSDSTPSDVSDSTPSDVSDSDSISEDDMQNLLNELQTDPLDQMNSIIDQATEKTETVPEVNLGEDHALEDAIANSMSIGDVIDMANEQNKDNTTEESGTMSDNFGFNEDIVEENPSYDALMITDDDVLEGIDFDEDLTKDLTLDGSIEDYMEESQLSERELKKLKKKEEKERKKAEKLAAKNAKKAAKQAAKVQQPVGEDVIQSVADVAAKGLDQAVEDKAEEVDLDGLFEGTDDFITADEQTDTVSNAGEKISFMQKLSLLLFGPEEEEDQGPTEEEIAKAEAKKAEKERKKEEKAAAKEEKEAAKAVKKNQAKEMAVVKKAAAKDKKEKIRQEEEEEDAKEKKITPKAVISVVVILSLLGSLVVFGTNQFNYTMVIKRAENYFEMQKYRKAYEQIVGVDVKDRDKQIKDKIYCVMYVQNQLDSYKNFTTLEMYESALDSLVKGSKKYDEHIEEARALGIESDLDGLKSKIDSELQSQYGLSPDQINEWKSLDQENYTRELRDFIAARQGGVDMEIGMPEEE